MYKLLNKIFDNLFKALGENTKISLKLQLFKLGDENYMKSGGKFPIHLNAFKRFQGKLASIKTPTKDSIALLLKSFLEEYGWNILATLL